MNTMSSVCISNCVNDARDPRVPVRATYVNLYKWPESDAEFVRSVSSRGCRPASSSASATATAIRYGHPRVVDSISCRQIYLRSYKFSREEDYQQKKKKNAHNCFGCRPLIKPKLADDHDDRDDRDRDRDERGKKLPSRGPASNKKKKKRCLFLGKVKEISYAALFGIFQRCLSCSATVDVVDH
ncbi:hypothetical protein TIFTF001_008284 [Ficus carica]|uniref:Uncharacterized protein n=1 Tax=Ficus carica TaxID=3494 RepID=A0AA88DGZ1_FICCA|nr:hypothetical protein TIFTF001_008284 [Ficus carica]